DISPSLVLTDDISADGDLRFAKGVELMGAGSRIIGLVNAGDTVTFDALLDSATNTGLTLNLNGGGTVFTGAVGSGSRVGDILVNNLGGALLFSSTLTANSLVSQSGAGAVVLTGAVDLDPNPGADNPATERLVVSAADITIGATVTTDLIDLTFNNSLSLGVLNAETVQVTGVGQDLLFRLPDNIGEDVRNLLLQTTGIGDILIVGTPALVDLANNSGDATDRDVTNARFIAGRGLVFAGPATEWRFQNLFAGANQGIIFSVTAPLTFSWIDALDPNPVVGAGVFAFDADMDNAGDENITILSADFTFTDRDIAGAGVFAMQDDIDAAGNLTIDRDARLFADADGIITIALTNNGNAVADTLAVNFNNILTAETDTGLTLDFSGIEAGDTAGAAFAAQV
ncbi:MAG: hypothetical protein K8E66_07850, partial [Phycisphaerales bacterium]|nr:hypothetical protein [Phycisphaerales bacterium]